MKLKQCPEDFVVEEISSVKIQEKGDFKSYRLWKKGIETFALLKDLSNKFKIPLNEIGIAGLKDKHAVTLQYLTAPSSYEIDEINEDNLKIKFLGYAESALKYGDLVGNRFEIIARDISKGEIEGIKNKAKDIEEIGVPNYFDSQRFGSVIFKGEFIAKYLIKQDYENACRIFLTQFTKSESARIKNDKKMIFSNWKSLARVNVNTGALRYVVQEYIKTKSWAKAYRKIPGNVKEMAISAYQSYLWNECIKWVFKDCLDKTQIYTIPYNLGNLIYYKNTDNVKLSKLPKSFPTISHTLEPNGFISEIINRVLAKEEVSINQFNIRKETGNFFKTHDRQIIVYPADFSISDFEDDEFNRNRKKVKICFTLSKGSYATVVTKRLFNK